MNASASFKKLNDGNWGIRVTGTAPVAGAGLVVAKRDGSTSSVVVDSILSSIVEKGETVTICSIKQTARKTTTATTTTSTRGVSSGYRRSYGRRECKTGGNCSSFGSGRSCGGEDCDGY